MAFIFANAALLSLIFLLSSIKNFTVSCEEGLRVLQGVLEIL